MQSGAAGTKQWCAEFSPSSRLKIDPLIGWSGSMDTDKQIRLFFETQEQAIAWAQSKNLQFVVEKPKTRKIKPKSYTENFISGRVNPWTH
jgi:hypothetical protein